MASASASIPPEHVRPAIFAHVARSTNVTLAQPLGGRLTGVKPSPGNFGSQLLSGRASLVSRNADRVLVPAIVY